MQQITITCVIYNAYTLKKQVKINEPAKDEQHSFIFILRRSRLLALKSP